ncbi:bacterial transcriptional activator domain-containing protein [Actinomadura sp. ATCC 31491]|uniref:Bacterial transcriptional activator domain-containing protein n=1 Tax=Actinomadura luzonensis TaxID=2805427 RepID=A0ABT0G9J1_9ACTN|nr:bacterial transcriptional activator domain-containing protein [Actinomadura luzonensis]MCK2221272.1 bacterial transcriptional activator domain-containing protein [Actinomadura luzonensis]
MPTREPTREPARPHGRHTPARIPARRRAGDVLAGLGALVLLVALVGGVPYALLRFGPRISLSQFSLETFTGQLGPSTITALLGVLVWLAWFQLFVCVLVEVYAGVRRIGMPARVPLSGGTQAIANKLVGAVLLLFTTGAMVAPIAKLAPQPAAPPVTAVAYSAPIVEKTTLDTHKTKKVYVVQPPHGRHHESLWEIAEKCLGDGRRYHEIYRLNQAKEQPDGSRLRMADLIRPGWVLDMPDDARHAHIVPVDQPREQTLREHPGRAHVPADRHAEQRTEPERTEPKKDTEHRGGAKHRLPEQEQRQEQRQEQGRDAGPRREQPVLREAPSGELVEYLASASLAAAGLLFVLARRRREQLWNRVLGRRIARPHGDAAEAEVALRLGGDAPGARILDIGLRLLGAELAAQNRTPPTVYAAHLSPRTLDLWVHPPDPDPPAPWTAQDGGQVWRLPAHEGRLLEDQPGGAPYPGLVSIGTNAGGRVLVDLEAAQGLINVRGPQTTAALAAIAVELATNRWSDRMRVTLVGFGAELTAIAPDRIRAVGGLAEVLPELEAAAAPRREVLTGRVTGSPREAHYLLSAVAPTHEEARRLALLARRDTAGYVVAGDVPHATWTLEITEDGKARIAELGFEVQAQLLPRRHYRALVELFRTAGRMDGEPIPGPEPLTGLHPPAVEIRVLGPVEILGVRPLEEGRMALAAEMLVYLATHPGGVHPVVLGGVLWPRGVQSMVRDATIARVAEWLGPAHLLTDEAGRLRLGPGVRTDWMLFRELVRRSHGDPTARPILLEKALGLVRGPLLTGRPPGRYAWLAAEDLEYDVAAEVADAAHQLCELRLAQGQADAAVAAVRQALLLAADDEGLWRDLLRATHATQDNVRLRAVVEGLTRRAASHPYGGGLAPETEALIEELLPTWRIHVVRESSA